jgi:hypothetical protein
MAYGDGGDIRQEIRVDLQAIGADTASILAQAVDELQGKFRGLVQSFDDGEISANELIGGLRGLAGGFKQVEEIAGAEVAAMERAAAAQAKAAEAARKLAEAEDAAAERRVRAFERVADAERAAFERGQAAILLEIQAQERRARAVEAAADQIIRANEHASAERVRAAEEEAERIRQAEGDIQRARIDRIAREERAEQERAAFVRKLNQDLIEDDAARFAAAASLAAQKSAALAEAAKLENENRAAQIEAAASLAAQKKSYLDQEIADQRKAYGDQLLAAEALATQKAAALAKAAADEKKNRDAQIEAAASLAAQKKAYLDQELGDQMRANAERHAREERELEELRAQFARNADARRQEAQAEVWMTRQTDELTAALQGMHAVERTAATDIDRGTTAIERQAAAAKEAAAHAAGFASAAEMGADRTKRMGYAAMNASYLFQDMQYGIGAVANNIGLMAMSAGNAFPKLNQMTAAIGGTAGLGAAVMAGAVAIDLLYHNWEKISEVFGAALPPKLIGDVKGLQEELKKLTEKKWKTAVDYQDIEIATEKLRKLTALEAAYQRLRGHKTEEEEAVGKAVSEAITTHGGGDAHMTAVDRVTRAVEASMPVTESAQTYTLRRKIEEARANHQEIAYEDLENLRTYQAADRKNREEAAKAIVGGASMGDEAQRAELQRIFRENRKRFAAMGVKDEFGEALGEAAPDRRAHAKEVDAEFEASDELLKESVKAIKDRFKALRKAEKEAGTDRGTRTRGAVSTVGPAFDEDLEKSIFDAMKGGATADRAMAARRAELIPKLRARGVEEDVVQDVASAILEKAAAAAQNLIAEGKKPKLDVRAEAETKKVETAKEKEIREQVTRFKPGVDEALERTMLGHIGAGATPERSMAQLLPQLRDKLQAQGVAADVAGPVAEAIIRKVVDQVNNKLSEMMLNGARSRPGAARGLLDLEIAKEGAEGDRNQGILNKRTQAGNAIAYAETFQGMTGANDDQAREAGRRVAAMVEKGTSVDQAMRQVFDQMMRAMAQVQAQQEAMMGIIGPATVMLAQFERRQRALGANTRALNNQNRRNAQNRDTLLPRQFPGMN